MLLKAKKKNGVWLVSTKAVKALAPQRRKPWAKLSMSERDRFTVMQQGSSIKKDTALARLCMPRWVNKLIAQEQLRPGLRVRLLADTPRRMNQEVCNGTVIKVVAWLGLPYLRVRLDGQATREALFWHPSHLKLVEESVFAIRRTPLRYHITYRRPQRRLREAA